MKALSTEVLITYNGKDITRDLRPYLISFTFTDNSGGKADDISLTLQDAKGLWLRDWVPAKSDVITASILKGTRSLPCGSFSVDQVDYAFPPRTLSIKAVSSDITKQSVFQVKTRVWENTTLTDVCSEIAGNNGLLLYLEAEGDYPIERLDQVRQSDLDFLRELCEGYDWSIKTQKDTLIVYDTGARENLEPALNIDADDASLLNARFTSKSARVYRKARVRYHDPVRDETYDEDYDDYDEEGSERDLDISAYVESKGDAKRLAQKSLTQVNRREITGSITLTGRTDIAAGVTVMLSGFGMFSGRHFITKVTHKVDASGFTTTIEVGQPKESKRAGHSRKGARKTGGGTLKGELYYEGEKYYH